MSTIQVQQSAERLLATLDMKGHRAQFVEVVARERFPNEWGVIFDLYSPAGNLVDGPLVVLVDKKTGEARIFESA